MEADQVQFDGGVAVIRVDEHDCAGLWPLLRPLIEDGRRAFVLDFTEVDYLNSMNIAAIISLRSRLEDRGARLLLCCMRPQVASIFRVLKLERLFDLTLERDAAVHRAASA